MALHQYLEEHCQSGRGYMSETAPLCQKHLHCYTIKKLALWYGLFLYMGTECSKEEHQLVILNVSECAARHYWL